MKIKTIKTVSFFLAFILAFFVNFDWFFDYCARNYCPDTYGPIPLIALHPNFYIPKQCGGIDGTCIPAYWSLALLVKDIIVMIVLSTILSFIIKTITQKNET